jgi:hypothetical protein
VLTAKDITAEDRRRLAGQADRVIAKGSLSLADLASEVRGLVGAEGHVEVGVEAGIEGSVEPV